MTVLHVQPTILTGGDIENSCTLTALLFGWDHLVDTCTCPVKPDWGCRDSYSKLTNDHIMNKCFLPTWLATKYVFALDRRVWAQVQSLSQVQTR